MPLSGDAALDALHVRVLTQAPEAADAIVWLQGNGYDRGPKALELFHGRYAPCIVITGNAVRSPITVHHLAAWLRDRGVPESAILRDAASMHTRDQAVHVLTVAQERAWSALLLVASPHHQLRAFLTFLKCAQETGWDGRTVNQPADILWNAVPSERDRTNREIFTDELAKLDRYAVHVASAADAFRYFQYI